MAERNYTEKLARLRKARGFTKTEFADVLNASSEKLRDGYKFLSPVTGYRDIH